MTVVLRSLVFAVVIAAPVAAAAGESMVYIPLGEAGEVLIVDPSADRVVGRIADLPAVHGLAGAPGSPYLVAGSFAEAPAGQAAPEKPAGMSAEEHAAHHGGNPEASKPASEAASFVSVVRAADGKVVRRIEVPGAVHHVAMAPDGRYAVATHPGGDGISVIDLEHFKTTAYVETGPLPNYAAVSGDGSRVYVSNAGNDTVSEVDATTWTVRRNLAVGASPEHLVLSPDGSQLYVANVGDGTVSEIDLPGGRVSRTFEIGGSLHGLDVAGDGETLFVSALERGQIAAIDLASGDIRRAVVSAPYHLAVIARTGKLYVSSADEPKVRVVDAESLAAIGEIAVRGTGHQIAVVPR
jgi:YVTN family beta-propeller protein